MFKPKPTYHPEIKGLISFELDSFKDHRGMNFEIYESIEGQDLYGLDSCSVSSKNVLRGLHFDNKNDKLIQILFGKVQLFLVDTRENSPTFNNIKEFILDYQKPTQIFIPKKVANGHLVLSDNCVFYYKWSHGYKPQQVIKWNDPRFSLKWLTKCPILSNRDK